MALRRSVLSIAFGILVSTAITAHAEVVTSDAPVCPSKESISKLGDLSRAHSKDPHDVSLNQLNAFLQQQGCIVLHAGMRVHVTDFTWGGLTKVRPDGSIGEFWDIPATSNNLSNPHNPFSDKSAHAMSIIQYLVSFPLDSALDDLFKISRF